MQIPHKALAGLKPQEVPAKGKPFAGRSALVSGLRETAKGYEEAPPVIVSREAVESGQIIQSRQIFETVLDIVTARGNMANFREELISQARAIAAKRDLLKVPAPKKEPVTFTGKPSTLEEALERALVMKGFEVSSITLLKQNDETAMFSFQCNGEESKIPLRKTIMDAEDPVGKVIGVLSLFSVGVTDEERRKKSVAALRSTRPPPTPLGIESKELDGRMIHFDGESLGKWFFTYTYNLVESTFSFTREVTGQDLLDMIDERVDMFHRQSGLPYPANVLEWRSRDRAAKKQLEGVPVEVAQIACTLDYLATCPLKMRDLVPPEYLVGFDALKKLPPPYPAFLRAADKASLDEALDALDHPINSILRERFGRDGAGLSMETQQEALALLQMSSTVAVDVCDAAIGNIAEAHALTGNDNLAAFARPDEQRKGYFRLVFSVRKAISDAIADGTLEIDS